MTKVNQTIAKIMDERFGCDNVISLATHDGERLAVRSVNAYYENSAFYIVTYGLSNKMQQIEANRDVAICGEWFNAHGIAENLGHVLKPENREIMSKLRAVFAEWYDNGHTNENDANTILLRINLTDGVLFYHGTRYDVDFT